MARKTHTSSEVKKRWIDANYQRYMANFRKDTDKEIIDYIDARREKGDNTTEILREAVEMLMNSEK